MLFFLQRRGQATAGELAGRLEVSERTILRDVDALSEAGVPIFATPGSGGGIRLMDGFDLGTSGLTTPEAECVLLAGQTRLAQRLGFGPSARTARHKLLAALGDEHRRSATGIDDWLLADPDPWTPDRIPYGELRRIGRCVRERREVELRLGPAEPIRARPFGLVTKSGDWHLVHGGSEQGDETTVTSLADLVATRITRVRFERPDGFDLERFWDDHVARLAGSPDHGA